MKAWLSGRRPAFDRGLMIALLILLAVSGGFTACEHVKTERLAREGAEAHRAICTFRGDLQERVDAGRRFLFTHPEGFAGIDAPTIRNSLDNQQKTVDALSGIHCDTKGATP